MRPPASRPRSALLNLYASWRCTGKYTCDVLAGFLLALFILLTQSGDVDASTRAARVAAPLQSMLVPGDLNNDTTLSAANSPYVVSGIIYVPTNATLTVEPGVVIQFESNSGLIINGKIIAIGTAAQPITLTATTPSPGWWRGLRIQGTFSAPTTGSTLEHVIIEYGGGPISYASNLYLEYTTVTVRHSVFRFGSKDGIYGFNGGVAQLFDSHFQGNADYAVYLADSSRDPVLERLSATGNGTNGVAIGGTSIANSQLWEASGLPYVIAESKTVLAGATLTLAPGAELRFGNNTYLEIKGALNAIGASQSPILLTGTMQETGWWIGVRVVGTQQAPAAATFEHVIIEYGGRASDGANLSVEEATVELRHSHLRHARLYGLLPQIRANVSVDQTTFAHNGQYPILIDESATSPTLSNLTLTGNGTNGVAARGVLDGPHLWQAIGYPYIIDADLLIRINGALTLQPGVEVLFAQDTMLSVAGSLTAVGTPDAPVRFSGTTPQPGWWQGIILSRADATAYLRYCEIAYGGSEEFAQPLLSFAGARALVQDCYIHHSATEAIAVMGGTKTYLRGNRIEMNSTGVQNRLTTGRMLDARYNWWGHASGPFHPTLNPAGKGNPVSDNVLFDPWLDAPEGKPVEELVVLVSGATIFEPGSTQRYAVEYNNSTGAVLQNAVLAVLLPSHATYMSDSGGGIYWPERHELFWKVGTVAPGEVGVHSFEVQYEFGLPADLPDSVIAFLGGSNAAPANFNVSPYLAFEPRTIHSEVELSAAQVTAERQSHAQLEQLFQSALADGFVYSTGFHYKLNSGEELRQFLLLRFEPEFVANIIWRHGANIYSYIIEPHSFSVKSANGMVRYDMQYGGWVSPDATLASLTQESPGWEECTERCIIKKVPGRVIKKGVRVVSAAGKAVTCVKAANGDIASMAKCGNALAKKLYKEVPGLGEGIDIAECSADCKECDGRCDDPKCHCCTEDKYMCTDGSFPYWGVHTIQKYTCDVEKGDYKTSWGMLFASTVQVCATCEKCVLVGNSAACVREESQNLFAAQTNLSRMEPASLTVTTANPSSKCQKCRVAKDPNAKFGPQGDLVPGQHITYTITYENEGAAVAYDVFILDTLGEHFDDTTLTVYGGGDYIEASRTLIWDVGNLNPKNQPGSTGVVSFTVQLKTGLPSGTVITNQAVVHFPSVPEETPTNTVVNTIQPLVAVPQQIETSAGQSANIMLAGIDVVNSPLTYALVEEPLYGTLSGTLPKLVYTPGAGFAGQDVFRFVVSNGTSTSRPAAISIQVKPSSSDKTPPAVVATSPAANATVRPVAEASFDGANGPVYAPLLLVTFSEAMDATSFVTGTAQVKDAAGQLLHTDLYYDAQTDQLAILLREPLVDGREYTATVNTTAKDVVGNALAAPYSWRIFAGSGRGGAFIPSLHR